MAILPCSLGVVIAQGLSRPLGDLVPLLPLAVRCNMPPPWRGWLGRRFLLGVRARHCSVGLPFLRAAAPALHFGAASAATRGLPILELSWKRCGGPRASSA